MCLIASHFIAKTQTPKINEQTNFPLKKPINIIRLLYGPVRLSLMPKLASEIDTSDWNKLQKVEYTVYCRICINQFRSDSYPGLMKVQHLQVKWRLGISGHLPESYITQCLSMQENKKFLEARSKPKSI